MSGLLNNTEMSVNLRSIERNECTITHSNYKQLMRWTAVSLHVGQITEFHLQRKKC